MQNVGFLVTRLNYQHLKDTYSCIFNIITLGTRPRGRVGKVSDFQRSLSFDHLIAVTGVGSSPALATCETSHVLLAAVSGGFPGVLPFRPTYRLARLDMCEIILKGTLN